MIFIMLPVVIYRLPAPRKQIYTFHEFMDFILSADRSGVSTNQGKKVASLEARFRSKKIRKRARKYGKLPWWFDFVPRRSAIDKFRRSGGGHFVEASRFLSTSFQ